MPGWEGRVRLDKDERKIVRRHLHDLAQFQPVKRGLADEVFYVSRTPQRGSRLLRSASKAALDAVVCVPPSMKGP